MTENDLDRINEILLRHFPDAAPLAVTPSLQSLPLVAANVQKSTRSFSQGQVLYVYDVFWGMNERARVVGRYRRKHGLILGVCPIANLENFRPKLVYAPAVIGRLAGFAIDPGIFLRFFSLPGQFLHIKDYIRAIAAKQAEESEGDNPRVA